MHVENHHIWYTDSDFYHKVGVDLTVSAVVVAGAWCFVWVWVWFHTAFFLLLRR